MNDESLLPLARRLIIAALVFLESSHRLAEVTRSSARFADPTYYLLCHGIELTLKSYLAASGLSEKKLRDLRHDLKRALRCARRRGFVPADDRFPEIVEWLAPYHLDHFLRYPTMPSGGPPHQFPSLAEASKIVDATATAIDAYVRGKFSQTSEGK